MLKHEINCMCHSVFLPDEGCCTGNLYDSSHRASGASHLSGAACVCGSACFSDAQNRCEMDSQLLEKKMNV